MQRAISSLMGPNRTAFPPTDTIETAEYYQLESELPGYQKSDIQVKVTNANTLVLSGTLHEDSSLVSGSGVDQSTQQCMHQVREEAKRVQSQEKQAEQERKKSLQEAKECQESLDDKVSAVESKSSLADAKQAEITKCKLDAEAQQKYVQESKAALETSQVHAEKAAQEAEEAKKKAESYQAGQARKKSVLGQARDFIDTQAKNVQVEMKQAQAADAKKAVEKQQKKVDDESKKAEEVQKECQQMEDVQTLEVKDIKNQAQGSQIEAQELKEQVQVKQEQAHGGDQTSHTEQGQVSKTSSEEHRKPVKARYLTIERNTVEFFSRVFTFSCNIEEDQVKATLQNGILNVLVPKFNADSTRHINID